MENPNSYKEMMGFFSAIKLYSTLSDEQKAEFNKTVKEGMEAFEKENPNQPLNLIVTDVDEWPEGWPEAIEELQRGIL